MAGRFPVFNVRGDTLLFQKASQSSLPWACLKSQLFSGEMMCVMMKWGAVDKVRLHSERKKGGTEREREVLLVWDLWIPEELIDINKTVQLPQGMGFWNHISVPLTFTVSFSNGGCSGCMQPERRIGDTQ